MDSDGDGIITESDRLVTAADGLKLGVFWGVAGGPAETLVGEMVIREGLPGILGGLPNVLPISGAGAGGTVISLQIRATSPGWAGSTGVKQVILLDPVGPGNLIWSHDGRTVAGSQTFRPEDLYLIPEPSTLALGALGGLMLLFRLRKSNKE